MQRLSHQILGRDLDRKFSLKNQNILLQGGSKSFNKFHQQHLLAFRQSLYKAGAITDNAKNIHFAVEWPHKRLKVGTIHLIHFSV